MNYTENLSLGLPEYGESADVADLNRNSGILDAYCYNTRQIECEPYDSTKTYMSGDLAIHNEVIYECNTDNTAGTWDDSKWDSTTLAEQIAKAKQSGGESALADLDDVEITNPSTGQALLFDDDDDLWKNQNLPDASVTKTATGNPIEVSDSASAPMVKCVTAITGSQDLHGYDKPWVGGAGKNKFSLTLAGLISDNTSGTWSGNTYTINGAIFNVSVNDDGYVTKITASKGNAAANLEFNFSLDAGTYILSSGFSEVFGSDDTYLQKSGATIARGNSNSPGQTFTLSETSTLMWRLRITNGTSINCFPMIRLATVSDATFAPYSNICPITAYTEGEIVERGKNIFCGDVTAINKTTEYRPNTGQRANLTKISDNSFRATGNNGAWSVGYYEIDGIDGTLDYAISYTVKDNDTSYTPTLTKGAESDENKLVLRVSFGNNSTLTTSQGATFDNVQVEVGTTATAYEPYTSTTHTTTFPSAIYRGSEDVVGGSVNVTFIKASSLVWSYSQTGYFYATPNPAMKGTTSGSEIPSLLCDRYETTTPNNVYSGSKDCSISTSTASPFSIWIRDNSYNGNVTDFANGMANSDIVYELATPTTSSVTPTNLPIKSLSGYNHIESSTGEMEVEYITEGYQPLVDLIQSSNGHTYSTQEQVVGKWIDGNDLYEQTITGTADYDVTGLNVVEIFGVGHTTGGAVVPFPYSSGDDLMVWIGIYNGASLLKVSTTYTLSALYRTIRYTKPTATRSLSAPVTSQKAQIEPLTDKTEEVPTEEENEEENTNDER